MNTRLFSLACLGVSAIAARGANEIGFLEPFALADDRAAALKQLVPGTDEAYFYQALHLQNQGKRADLQAVLAQWAERHPQSQLREETRTRQVLLDYGADPKTTLDFIVNKLGLRFDYERQLASKSPALPVALDPAAVAEQVFRNAAMQGTDNLDQLDQAAVIRLIESQANLSGAQRRSALSKLTRPDVAGLVPLVVADLKTRESRGFGEFPIHGALTQAQLDELRTAIPALAGNQTWVLTYLRKLAPSADEDISRDRAARQAWLDRAWAFVSGLGAPFNSLKANILYQRLELLRETGNYDAAVFLEYVKLPRNVGYVRPKWREDERTWRNPADLAADFGGATLRPPIGTDEPLVRDFLLRLLANAPDAEAWAPYFEATWLKQVFAEARLTAGLDDPKLAEQLASALSPEQFERLKNRVDLDFDATNPQTLAPADSVSLDVWVKNVPRLTVKIFELNTAACYTNSTEPIGTDIDLDGLVAAQQQVHEFDAPPLHRVKRTFKLPEIAAKRGVWVVEFIGNGRSSRALVRKGHLSVITRDSSAGNVLTVLDEERRVIPNAAATFAGREFRAGENGEVVLPFTAQPGPQPLVVHDGTGFASLQTVALAGEAFALQAAFHVDREALVAGARAVLAVRPDVRLNGEAVSVALLENVQLTLTSTTLDGIASTKALAPFKLEDGVEAVLEFPVPERLATVQATLSAEVKSMLDGRKIPLSSAWTFKVNEIDRTAHVSDLHLGRTANGWFVEERGKNGEPKPERPVHFLFRHRHYTPQIGVSLKTDAKGRIELGALGEIASIEARSGDLSRTWSLEDDAVRAGSQLHAAAGESVFVPAVSAATQCSLLELRGGTYVKDWSASVADSAGGVEVKGLPAGDYELTLRPENRAVRLRLTAGGRVQDFIASPTRLLEATPLAPPSVASMALEGDALVIHVAHAGPDTRVHVAGTRYEPAFSFMDKLGALSFGDVLTGRPGTAESQYVSGRQLGDEYRYILERLMLPKFAGVMLPKPGLLLNPWAVRDTSTDREEAQEGDDYKRVPQAPAPAMEPAAAANQPKIAPPEPASVDPHSLDFLASPSAVSFNVRPDKEGVIRIPKDKLSGLNAVHVLALNDEVAVTRTLALPPAEIATRDLRLADGLDPRKHVAQQDEITLLPPEKPFTLEDAVSTRFETYGDLGRVFTLLTTLSSNPTLAEFSFVLEWPTFDAAKKQEMYSKYACHELSFFLSRKDPEFFRAVVQPYVKNKKDRTFLDEYLLELDLSRYLEPWRYGRLNTLERLLLGRRLPAQRGAEERALSDWLALHPISRTEGRRHMETALFGYFDDDVTTATAEANGRFMKNMESARRKLGRLADDKAGLALDALDAPAAPGASAPADGAASGGMGGGRASRARGLVAAAKGKEMADRSGGDPGEVGERKAEKKQDALRRQELAKSLSEFFFRKPETTKEWAENNYWHLLFAQQTPDLVPAAPFWLDYAQWDGQSPFVSTNFAQVTRTFTEMMLALSVLDLPFPSQTTEPEAAVDGAKLTLTPKTPLVLFHQTLKPAEVDANGPKLLVSQNFYRNDDRYDESTGEKVDRFVTDEFLPGVVYGAQIVVTNPTSSSQKLDVLFQIPRGARPVLGAKATESRPVELGAFSTTKFDVAFYFPKAGSFPHFPVHVARAGKVVAFAEPATFTVVDELSKPDTTTWAWVSQNADADAVLAFLDKANLHTLDLNLIAWRLKEDAALFRKVVALLQARRVYQPVVYSFGLLHNDPTAIREYLRQEGSLLAQAGPWLKSPLVDIDPVERGIYEQLEYHPLINARAHQLGRERTILNDRFREQYLRLLAVLAHKPALDDADRLNVACYLMLQDRLEEAIRFFGKVRRDAVHAALQYDWAQAWLALAQEDTKTARAVATARANEPVTRWREKFTQLLAHIDEMEGKAPAGGKLEDRQAAQDAMAAKLPALDLKVEGAQVVLDTRNVAEVTLNYYLMDLEFLFSTNPFVGQDSARFSQIQPNKTETVKLDASGKAVPLPREFQNRNVLVEAVSGGLRKSQPVYANELKVTVSEAFGQVQVRHAKDDRPLAKVYVKVYAEVNGQPKFYKDGYTDIRGRFDFASLSTDDLAGATRFSILILSAEHGATVREAKPPRQ